MKIGAADHDGIRYMTAIRVDSDRQAGIPVFPDHDLAEIYLV